MSDISIVEGIQVALAPHERAFKCRYIIGEIMYGGHVVEDWDRRLTSAYLQILFQEGLLEGQQIFPKFDFRAPTSSMNHKQVRVKFQVSPSLCYKP